MSPVDVNKLVSPNEPRAIRARVGDTQDPLPQGKKLEEKEFPKSVTPAEHGQAKGETSALALGKEDVKAHKEELQHMQGKGDAKHFGEPNNLSRRDPVNNMTQLGTSKEPKTR